MGATCGVCFSRPNYSNQSSEHPQIPKHSQANITEKKNTSLPREGSYATAAVGRKIKRKPQGVNAIVHNDEYFEASTAIVSEKKKAGKDIELIKRALNQNFVFTTLDPEQIEVIISKMRHYQVGAGQIIVEQGKPAINFFVVARGRLEVLVNQEKKKLIKQGMGFGETALMHDTERTATIRTVEQVELWGLDRQTFRRAIEAVSAKNYAENKQFIESIPSFQLLTNDQKEGLLNSLILHTFSRGQNIVNEGDPGDLLYIIKDGVVSCLKGDKEIRQMGKGDFFGEQALLYNSPRTATVRALSEVKCLSIKRSNLQNVLGSHLQQIIYKNSQKIALEKSQVLCSLDKNQIESLANAMTVNTYQPEQIVVNAGIPRGAKLWVVLKGELKGLSTDKLIPSFTCLDDTYMSGRTDEVHEEDLMATCQTDMALIDRELFEQAIGGELDVISSNNETINALRKVAFLRELSYPQLKSLINMVQVQQYSSGESIVIQGEIGETLYIIKSGKVDAYKDGMHLRTITKYDYFGERSLLIDQLRSATVVTSSEVECWALQKQDFLSIIGDDRREYFFNRIELQDLSISLDDLVPVKPLGHGMFGNVFLVAHHTRDTLYALKTVSRNKISAFEIYENLVLERKILMQLEHNMIMKLIRTFKDDHRVYFLTEYVNGMDLFDTLRQMSLLDDAKAKKYTACLLLIMEHLHEREIIYRDLKPENVMVDQDGYPKLIDLGTAKILNGRTFTIVGTPHYMAPEVISGKGYTYFADIWSIGVMLYEFIFGGVPFGEDEEDPFMIYEAIHQHRLTYPHASSHSQAKPLIAQLLSKNPAMRTGGSMDILKQHVFFSDLDWDELIGKRIKMPYVPNVPSYSQDIRNAKRSEIPLEMMIKVTLNQKEEANEPPPPARRAHPRLPSPDWDIEF